MADEKKLIVRLSNADIFGAAVLLASSYIGETSIGPGGKALGFVPTEHAVQAAFKIAEEYEKECDRRVAANEPRPLSAKEP